LPKRNASAIILIVLLNTLPIFALNIQPVKAEGGTIYIRADGSIDPPTAPIQRNGDIYTLADNITSDAGSAIVIERDNMMLDGAGHVVQGLCGNCLPQYPSSAGTGIYLYERENVTIRNVEIKALCTGIFLVYSSYNALSGNNITDCTYGIRLHMSSNDNNVVGNTFSDCGLFVGYSFGNRVEGNSVNGKPLVYFEGVSDYAVGDAGQVILVNCDNIRVENLDLSNTTIGLELWGTSNSRIAYNNMTDDKAWGIYLYNSSDNTIFRNNITNDPQGFWHLHSNNNNISRNIFKNDGLLVSNSYLNVIEENVVNGKPLVYLESVSDYVVDNAGQVILVNSSNITVENLDLSNAMCGIELWGTNSTIVRQNNITNNYRWGIRLLYFSSNNSITRNRITNNEVGITLDEISSNNSIMSNNVANNSRFGGIFCSSSNTLYHNNFVNNTNQVVVENSGVNAWDNGYPSGGNYWSDYNGTDFYRGSSQNESGLDGIGDFPYIIDQNNTDMYPLMTPWTEILGDVNGDRTVDIYDAILLASAYGSGLGSPNWNAAADINGDNIVDIYDAIILANNYGKTT
jgi:parallel beta-helix repeat protein